MPGLSVPSARAAAVLDGTVRTVTRRLIPDDDLAADGDGWEVGHTVRVVAGSGRSARDLGLYAVEAVSQTCVSASGQIVTSGTATDAGSVRLLSPEAADVFAQTQGYADASAFVRSLQRRAGLPYVGVTFLLGCRLDEAGDEATGDAA